MYVQVLECPLGTAPHAAFWFGGGGGGEWAWLGRGFGFLIGPAFIKPFVSEIALLCGQAGLLCIASIKPQTWVCPIGLMYMYGVIRLCPKWVTCTGSLFPQELFPTG